jgi:hypothetical protein
LSVTCSTATPSVSLMSTRFRGNRWTLPLSALCDASCPQAPSEANPNLR